MLRGQNCTFSKHTESYQSVWRGLRLQGDNHFHCDVTLSILYSKYDVKIYLTSGFFLFFLNNFARFVSLWLKMVIGYCWHLINLKQNEVRKSGFIKCFRNTRLLIYYKFLFSEVDGLGKVSNKIFPFT